MPTPSDMTGKVAVVTGAASGLGRATALALARAGASLSIIDVNEAGLAETAGLLDELGQNPLVQKLDLSSADQCKAGIAATVAHFGKLDALCNVAGIIIFAHSADMRVTDWEKTIAVNLSAPFFLAQAAIPYLLQQHGAIVNVTSSAAFVGEAYLAAYCASKAGLTHMTKAMAMEYINQPIRINAVAPGGMATPLGATIKMPESVDYTLIKRFTPLRGLVEVDDVAQLTAFLASDAARGYHGACLSIDCGITAG
jgi:NAD(P)-dependent dehydrogenase (short-subunit alcohol dehydrogenase family)